MLSWINKVAFSHLSLERILERQERRVPLFFFFCLSAAQVNGLFQVSWVVSSICVMLLVVLDTILETMCFARKPAMHECQTVPPGGQQYSTMRVG